MKKKIDWAEVTSSKGELEPANNEAQSTEQESSSGIIDKPSFDTPFSKLTNPRNFFGIKFSSSECKEKYNPSYEKAKTRPLNLIVTILSIIALSAAMVGVAGFIITSVVKLFSGDTLAFGGSLFNEKTFAFTLGFSGVFGVLIYLLLGCLVVLLSILAIPLIINGINMIKNGFKVNAISDKDYYKNIFVKQIISYSIYNILISLVYLILILMFKAKIFMYLCIAGAAVYAVVMILAIIAYFVNISRFKKKASKEELASAEESAKYARDYVKAHNFYYGKRKRKFSR